MSKKNLHEDKYHNTDLSYAIEEGKFEQIKTLLNIKEDISYPDLLKLVGMRAHNNDLEKDFIVSKEGQQRIFYEAKDKLDLLGEDYPDFSVVTGCPDFSSVITGCPDFSSVEHHL